MIPVQLNPIIQMTLRGLIVPIRPCLVLGYLIGWSAFLPRILGVLMAVAGLCYLTNSFASFLAPAFGAPLFYYILAPSFLAELTLCLWLLVMGVNVQGWKKQASAAAVRA